MKKKETTKMGKVHYESILTHDRSGETDLQRQRDKD
jgi:hypothetical protein